MKPGSWACDSSGDVVNVSSWCTLQTYGMRVKIHAKKLHTAQSEAHIRTSPTAWEECGTILHLIGQGQLIRPTHRVAGSQQKMACLMSPSPNWGSNTPSAGVKHRIRLVCQRWAQIWNSPQVPSQDSLFGMYMSHRNCRDEMKNKPTSKTKCPCCRIRIRLIFIK